MNIIVSDEIVCNARYMTLQNEAGPAVCVRVQGNDVLVLVQNAARFFISFEQAIEGYDSAAVKSLLITASLLAAE